MSAPPTKKNNLIKISNKVKIDSISKYFILLEVLCGVFRLHVLGVTRRCFVIMLFGFTVLYNVLISYFVYPPYAYQAQVVSFIKFLSCTFLGHVLYRRLLNFYVEINRIDTDLSFKVSNHLIAQYLIYIFQILAVVISFGILFYFFPHIKSNYIVYLFPMKLLHYLELNYYGHLFNLIIPRLKFLKNIVNVCFKSEKSNNDSDSVSDFELFKKAQRKRVHNYDVVSLIYSYNNFINAYDYLNSAIKWQMVITLMAIFIEGLNSSYHIAKLFLYGSETAKIPLLLYMLFLILEFMPLMVPCLYANEVCNVTDQLKEMLTCKLYEHRLDKNSRRAARALLDLLQTRPLYFPLLHMFHVDLALPFKILGLILTYLIILLQFDKIINPDQVRGTLA